MIGHLPIPRPDSPGTPRAARSHSAAVTFAILMTVTVTVAAAAVGQALAAAGPPAGRCTKATAPPGGQYWHHPVDAPIVDGFRPPAGPYGSGNRGLEYGTSTGDPVSAVADGVVSFSGSVGRSRFVTVRHPSGLRSTYAYLTTIEVAAGDPVVRGRPIAEADRGFHLTARQGDSYIDPLLLLLDGCSFVKLVPVPPADRLTMISG